MADKEQDEEISVLKDLTESILNGTYIDNLLTQICAERKCFDKLYKKVKRNISKCRAELIRAKANCSVPEEVRNCLTHLQHTYVGNSKYLKRKEKKETVIKRYREEISKIKDLPYLRFTDTFKEYQRLQTPIVIVRYEEANSADERIDEETRVYNRSVEDENRDEKRNGEATGGSENGQAKHIAEPSKHLTDTNGVPTTTITTVEERKGQRVDTGLDNSSDDENVEASDGSIKDSENEYSDDFENSDGEERDLALGSHENTRASSPDKLTKGKLGNILSKDRTVANRSNLNKGASKSTEQQRRLQPKIQMVNPEDEDMIQEDRKSKRSRKRDDYIGGANQVEMDKGVKHRKMERRQNLKGSHNSAPANDPKLESKTPAGMQLPKRKLFQTCSHAHGPCTNVKPDDVGDLQLFNLQVDGKRASDINTPISYRERPFSGKIRGSISKMKRALTCIESTLRNKETNEHIYSINELPHRLATFPEKQLSQNSRMDQGHNQNANENDDEHRPIITVLDNGDAELPTCTDVKMFDKYVVVSAGEELLKLDRTTEEVSNVLSLKSAGKMCSLGKMEYVGVIQTNQSITVVATDSLTIKYKIKTNKPYTNICYIGYYGRTDRGLPDPSFEFGLVYSDRAPGLNMMYCEKVDILRAKKTAFLNERVPVYEALVRTIDISPFGIPGISGIGAFPGSWKKIILCGASKVICIEKPMEDAVLDWEININKAATDVLCANSMVYVCVQDEGRIMLLDKDGNTQKENILEGVLECLPHKVSVHGDEILVKSFDMDKWRNLICRRENIDNTLTSS